MKTTRRNILKFKGFNEMAEPKLKTKPALLEYQATPEQWAMFEKDIGRDLTKVLVVRMLIIFEGGKPVMIRFHNPKRLFWNN